MSAFIGHCCDCRAPLPGVRPHRFRTNPYRRCWSCHEATWLPDGSERPQSEGYMEIKIGGKWVLKHRHVMEQKLGCPLRPGEVVHHDNERRDDNDPKNLVLCESAGKHVARHHPDAIATLAATRRGLPRHYQQHVYCSCGFNSRRIARNGSFGVCPRCGTELSTQKAA